MSARGMASKRGSARAPRTADARIPIGRVHLCAQAALLVLATLGCRADMPAAPPAVAVLIAPPSAPAPKPAVPDADSGSTGFPGGTTGTPTALEPSGEPEFGGGDGEPSAPTPAPPRTPPAPAPRHKVAPPSSDAVAAEALFVRARDLMLQRRFAEACPLFEASAKLEPAAGTLMNLAACHRDAGRGAQACRAWAVAAAALAGQGATERARFVADQRRLAHCPP